MDTKELYQELLKGTDFAKDQASIVARQLIKWKITINVLALFGLGLFYAMMTQLVFSPGGAILFLSSMILSVGYIGLNLIKLIFMPNLYIFEYLKDELI